MSACFIGEDRVSSLVARQLGTSFVDDVLATIPSVDAIIAEARALLEGAGELTPARVTADFGESMTRLESKAFEQYIEHERRALNRLVERWADECHVDEGEEARSALRRVFTAVAPDIAAFEFRAGQSRKSRGGSSWEKIGPTLLDMLGIPAEKPTGTDAVVFNEIDRIVPSVDVARVRPDQAAFISFKRTTRERWKVLVDEARLGYLYLVTQGSDITVEKIREMEKRKLIVYVPPDMKEANENFRASRTLRPFNDLPRDLRRFVP